MAVLYPNGLNPQAIPVVRATTESPQRQQTEMKKLSQLDIEGG